MTGQGYVQGGESKREKREGTKKRRRVKQVRLARTRGKAVASHPRVEGNWVWILREGKG